MCFDYGVASFLHFTRSSNINILICCSSWCKCLLASLNPRGHFFYLPFPKHPLLLIIIGGGGTGKSYLTNAIKTLLKQSCAVTTTTGKAAFSVNGCVIHSLLKLPVGAKATKT